MSIGVPGMGSSSVDLVAIGVDATVLASDITVATSSALIVFWVSGCIGFACICAAVGVVGVDAVTVVVVPSVGLVGHAFD